MAISLKSTVAAPAAAYPALKASIALFDCNPGTRSWTVPEGVSQIRAFVVGAGGGGFGGSTAAAGGGGGYSESLIDVTPGQLLSYTVGAPGLASSTARPLVEPHLLAQRSQPQEAAREQTVSQAQAG